MAYIERTQVVVEVVDLASARFGNIGRAASQTNTSFKNLVVGVSGLATAAVSLYMNFDRIHRSQVQLDRANLMVKRSTETLDQAQKSYNETIIKYGAASVEARDALDKVGIAQESLTVASERQQLAQENVSQTILTFAVTVVPTVITAVAGLTTALKAMGIAAHASLGPISLLIGAATLLGIEVYTMASSVNNAAGQIGMFTVQISQLIAETDKLLQTSKQLTYELWLLTTTEGKAVAAYLEWYALVKKTNEEWSNTAGGLRNDFNILQAEASEALKTIALEFDKALTGGNIDKATWVLLDFAHKFGISIKDAQRIIDEFLNTVETKLPETIDLFAQLSDVMTLEKATASAEKYIAVYKSAWESGMVVSVLTVANRFAHDMNVSLEQAIAILEELRVAVADVADPVSDLFDQLQSHWNLDRAEETGSKYVQAYARAWKSGYMVSVMQVAKKFADDMNISLGEAITILDRLMSKLKPEEDRTHKGPFTEWNEAARSYEWTLPEGMLPAPTITPISTSNDVTININAPLVNIEGSADRRTAVIAAETVKESLRNVVVEASSTAADATHKQIRVQDTLITNTTRQPLTYIKYGRGGQGMQP